MAEIPVSIMDWLINNQVIEFMFDLSITRLDKIPSTKGSINPALPWVQAPGATLFHATSEVWLLGCFPTVTHLEDTHTHAFLSKDNFKAQPGLLRFHWHDHNESTLLLSSESASLIPYPSARGIPVTKYWLIQSFSEHANTGDQFRLISDWLALLIRLY